MQLTSLLNKDREEEETILAFLTSIDFIDTILDSLYILTTSLYKVTFKNPSNLMFSTQLDVEEPETYE